MARIYLMAFLVCLLAGCTIGDFRMLGSQSDLVEAAPETIETVASDESSEADVQAPVAVDPGLEIAVEDSSVEETEAVAMDAETLEDMALLAGADQSAPEEEGETVAEETVAFDLPIVENAKVRYFVDYYSGRGRSGFRRWLERSGHYLPMMREVFAAEELPLDLTYLAMIESGFNPRAYSRAKAVGLWQFMASTGRMYGLNNNWWWDERRDPLKATRAAARHLKDLYRRFDDWYLAIAAYNAGSGKVERAIRRTGSRDFWRLCHTRHLRKETKNYLPKLLAVLLIAKEPEKYGFSDLNYQAPLKFDIAKLPSSTDVEIIARLCGVSYKEVGALNPELKRWCTPPAIKNYEIRLPAGKLKTFEEKYAQIPADRRANYQRHRIRSGDTLIGIAKRYGIRSKDIVALNNIRNPRTLRLGRDIILPLRPGTGRVPEMLDDGYVRSRQERYRVRRGDSLWTIARRFGVSTAQLCAWNGIGKDTVLRPGKVLRVAGGAKVSKSGRSGGTYRVQSGDSLWTISRRFGVSTAQLCAWNGISKSTVLRPGKVLQVADSAKVSRSGRSEGTYRVRSGDSLWTISRRFGVSTAQLCAWNGISKSTVLRPGEILRVAGGSGSANGNQRKLIYQVRAGDTLWEIGRRYDLKTHDIMRWNQLSSNDVLRPGDHLVLLVKHGSQG